ncbi:type I secretion system permease/ATPase [Sulfuricurvum sp.]|uniref:type I secretion system permease/ATPase n=1 Tax=Sulfuricurvum sp. TaxID=2025608 RepID=UPI003BB0DD1E
MLKYAKIDPLLVTLSIFTKRYGKSFSVEALTADLPVAPGKATAEMFSLNNSKAVFSRASARAGFKSKIVQRTLADISPLVLPVILILKDQNACILEKIDLEQGGAFIILPEDEEGVEQWVELKELEKQYLGFAFYLKKSRSFHQFVDPLIHMQKESWFWGSLKYSRKIYADVIIASLVINLFVLASPLFTMNVYDRVVPNDATETLYVLALGVVVVYFLDIILKFARSYFLEIAAKKSDVIISSILFQKVMNLKFSNIPESVGSFANNLKEFDSIRSFLATSTLALVIDLPFTIIFIVVIYIIGGIISIIPIVFIFLIMAYALAIKGSLQRSVESTYHASANKNAVLIESLNALETIRTMGISNHSQYIWEEATGDVASKGLTSRVLSNSLGSVTSFLIQLSNVFILIAGVYLIKELEMTMGGLIAVVILSSRALAPMGQVASLSANYEHTKTAYKTLDNIMNLPEERPAEKEFLRFSKFSGLIEFRDVTFTYPNETAPIFENLSFTIHPGEHVAFIGKIGSGKTTVLKLLLGLYTPDKGSVLMDNIDINQIDPADIRQNIGYVAQDITLFRGTVKSNIVSKAPYADDGAIIRAAKIGGVDEFVQYHPKGFDMPVRERGDGISGGQRQSIGIARAFLVDAPILLLDEPGNSMDESCLLRMIQKINENTKDKTLLLSTHDTRMLKMVNRIIVLDRGKIVLDGSKQEVMSALMRNNAKVSQSNE